MTCERKIHEQSRQCQCKERKKKNNNQQTMTSFLTFSGNWGISKSHSFKIVLVLVSFIVMKNEFLFLYTFITVSYVGKKICLLDIESL